MALYSSPENSCPILKSMYESKIHADVELSANGKKFSAHKAVLSSASEYFKLMFGGSYRESIEPSVIIQDICSDTLESVIKFIYYGSVEITSCETALQLMKTAHLMELSELMKYCRNYFKENMTPEVCLEVYCQANLIKDSSLTNKAKNMIARKFKTITQGDSFKNLNKDSFVELCTDMKEPISEDDIAEAILTWINNDESRLTHFKEILLLLKIENIERDVIIDQLYECCTGKEECGIIINALKKRKNSTKVVQINESQNLFILVENLNEEYALLEYDIAYKILLKQTAIPNYGTVLGFWGKQILFKKYFELCLYDIATKSICSSLNCAAPISSSIICSKIGLNVYILEFKNIFKLNLVKNNLEEIVIAEQLQSDCYELDAMCELNGELKIMAYNSDYSRIEIVTYNPLNNLWNIEPTRLNIRKLEFNTNGVVIPHKNCLYYFNSKNLYKYNLFYKTVNSFRVEPDFNSLNINKAVSIDDVLYVCTISGLYEYKTDENHFEKLDITEEELKCVNGICKI